MTLIPALVPSFLGATTLGHWTEGWRCMRLEEKERMQGPRLGPGVPACWSKASPGSGCPALCGTAEARRGLWGRGEH